MHLRLRTPVHTQMHIWIQRHEVTTCIHTSIVPNPSSTVISQKKKELSMNDRIWLQDLSVPLNILTNTHLFNICSGHFCIAILYFFEIYALGKKGKYSTDVMHMKPYPHDRYKPVARKIHVAWQMNSHTAIVFRNCTENIPPELLCRSKT